MEPKAVEPKAVEPKAVELKSGATDWELKAVWSLEVGAEGWTVSRYLLIYYELTYLPAQ